MRHRAITRRVALALSTALTAWGNRTERTQ